ncbi:MAG: aldo/keto reductase [Chromatiales bacterium]|nr:aldo/keto reductase [Chromatiales bacterium]
MSPFDPRRRRLLAVLAGMGLAGVLPRLPAAAAAVITRPIPATGERLPVIGLGTWLTFDVQQPAQRLPVMQAFFAAGGGLIDSSPMYGEAEAVVGWCLQRLGHPQGLFSATKVWTPGVATAAGQMADSLRLWGLERLDLQQVHNLVQWREHLETLKAWKAEGRIRYLGVTTSHGRRHDELEQIMLSQPLDFVQFTYNVIDREAERRLLPLAAERGIAVIVNRPFRGGSLFNGIQGRPLPPWAGEIDCANWAQFFLKFIVSHPAVTCAIPATTRVAHLEENMGAGRGRLPDADMRRRMLAYLQSL